MNPIVIIPPTEEPVSIELARAQLRVVAASMDSPPEFPEDAIIAQNIAAARESCEAFTQQSLAVKTIEVALDSTPCEPVKLPMGPVIEIVSVDYTDTAGNAQAMDPADYAIYRRKTPNELRTAYGVSWPSVRTQTDAVVIQYTAGYAPADVPKKIIQAMLLLIGHWFENREAIAMGVTTEELPLGVQWLLWSERVELGV